MLANPHRMLAVFDAAGLDVLIKADDSVVIMELNKVFPRPHSASAVRPQPFPSASPVLLQLSTAFVWGSPCGHRFTIPNRRVRLLAMSSRTTGAVDEGARELAPSPGGVQPRAPSRLTHGRAPAPGLVSLGIHACTCTVSYARRR